MLEYLYLAGGKGAFDLSGWHSPSLIATLAMLNGLFLFLYVSFKIAGGGPVPAWLAVVVLLVVVGANLVVVFVPELGPTLRGLMARL